MSERPEAKLQGQEAVGEAGRYLVYPGFTFDRVTREVHIHAKAETLRIMEASLLEFMHDNRGKVVSKSEISNGVWGGELYRSRSVDVHMSSLRRKLFGADWEDKETPLKTIRGIGYLLVDPEDLKR